MGSVDILAEVSLRDELRMNAVQHAQLAKMLAELQRRAGGYALLKARDPWGAFERGGDWDLAVVDTSKASAVLLEVLGWPVQMVRRSYVTSFHYEWCAIDLIGKVGWRGARVVSTDQIVADAGYSRDGLATARLAHQAIASWILPLLYSRGFNVRDRGLVELAARQDRRTLELVLRKAVGRRLTRRLLNAVATGRIDAATAFALQLRRAVVARSLIRRPLPTVTGAALHVRGEIVLALRPPTPVVGFTSIAGAREIARWALAYRRLVRGFILEDGSRSLVPLSLGSDADTIASALAAGTSTTASPVTWWRSRLLRGRGWLLVRRRVRPESSFAEIYPALVQSVSETLANQLKRHESA